MTGLYTKAIALLIAFAAGALAALWVQKEPTTAVIDPPAAEVRLKDGTTWGKRDASAPVTQPAPTLPKGSTRSRTAEVVVRVKPKTTEQPGQACPQVTCPDVALRLDTATAEDGSSRLAGLISEDGEIVSLNDHPVAPAVMSRSLPWAAGATYTKELEAAGAFLERDVGRLRIGGSLAYGQEAKLVTEIRLGIRFQ